MKRFSFFFIACAILASCARTDKTPGPVAATGRCPVLDAMKAAELAELTLKCSDTEYPNKQCYLYEKEEDLKAAIKQEGEYLAASTDGGKPFGMGKEGKPPETKMLEERETAVLKRYGIGGRG